MDPARLADLADRLELLDLEGAYARTFDSHDGEAWAALFTVDGVYQARGLAPWAVNVRHALRNCLMPVITVTGLQIGNLIAFALVTETVFQWPGMGLLFVQAVTFVDIPVMAAYLMLVSFVFVMLNTLVDLAYAMVDPRLRQDAVRHG